MHEAADHADSELLESLQAPVMPREIALPRSLRRNRFPDDGIADRLDAKGRHRIQIRQSCRVAGFDHLVAELVANTDDCTLDTAPQLDCFLSIRDPA
jgi:hypothetical protein